MFEPGSPASQVDSLPSEPPRKPIRRYHILFIHSLTDRHLNFFHILDIMNNVAMDICVHVFCVDISFDFLIN